MLSEGNGAASGARCSHGGHPCALSMHLLASLDPRVSKSNAGLVVVLISNITLYQGPWEASQLTLPHSVLLVTLGSR